MNKSGISMTSRILSVYHLFMNCEEVSVKEVMNQLPEMSAKTFYRDIKLLKSAGVLKVRYSKKAEAYIPLSIEPTEPDLPESRTKRLITEKIRRLCILMQELYEFDDEEKPLHIELYKELFPNVAVRTRQRDFAELAKLGYIRRRDIDYFCDEDKEKYCYSFEIPGTYSLNTFSERNW